MGAYGCQSRTAPGRIRSRSARQPESADGRPGLSPTGNSDTSPDQCRRKSPVTPEKLRCAARRSSPRTGTCCLPTPPRAFAARTERRRGRPPAREGVVRRNSTGGSTGSTSRPRARKGIVDEPDTGPMARGRAPGSCRRPPPQQAAQETLPGGFPKSSPAERETRRACSAAGIAGRHGSAKVWPAPLPSPLPYTGPNHAAPSDRLAPHAPRAGGDLPPRACLFRRGPARPRRSGLEIGLENRRLRGGLLGHAKPQGPMARPRPRPHPHRARFLRKAGESGRRSRRARAGGARQHRPRRRPSRHRAGAGGARARRNRAPAGRLCAGALRLAGEGRGRARPNIAAAGVNHGTRPPRNSTTHTD